MNNIVRHLEVKKLNIYFPGIVKFSPGIYIIDSLKLAKVFKLAVSSNSKNFLMLTLLHQLLNSTA